MATILKNGFIKTLTPYVQNLINFSHNGNEYFSPARLNDKEIEVKTCIFNPAGSKKKLFSIEFMAHVNDKKIYSRTIWDIHNGTVRFLFKDITASENNERGTFLDDKDTIDVQLFPIISGNGHFTINEEQEEFLRSCYEVHSKVLKQVFPEYKISYEI